MRRLEGGEINLVATQLQLEREHPNQLVFTPEAGLDPTVDIALTGSRLRALIKGRASAWQDNVTLTSTASRSQTAVGGEHPRVTSKHMHDTTIYAGSYARLKVGLR